MFQNTIEHVLGRVNKLSKDYSTNMLKLQALELLLVKVKEVDPTFIEKHDFKIISNQSPFEKIEAISKLKVQLMKCVNFLCRSETTGELSACKTFKSTLDKISEALSYFKSNKALFGNELSVYEQYLHVWFLRQCCMLKGPCWTQNFFTQPEIRKKHPIFASEKQSCVFSKLNPKSKFTWLETPFDKAFTDKYHDFKRKLSNIDTIKQCVITEKEDFVPLLIAALSISPPSNDIQFSFNIQSQLLGCNIVTRGIDRACITNLLRRDPAKIQLKIYNSSHYCKTWFSLARNPSNHQKFYITIDISHFYNLLIYLLYFTLFVYTYQIITANPFTILLNNLDQYENQRMPGEPPKNVKTSTFALHHCRNGHALLMKKRGTVRRVTKCTDPWCSAKIEEPALLAHQTNIQSEIDDLYVLLLQLLNSLTMLLRDLGELKDCPILIKLLQRSNNITEILWRRAKQQFITLCKMTELNEEQLSM
ncbi:hypothetical protein RFI_02629, partial [Reticulomyxa filosa]